MSLGDSGPIWGLVGTAMDPIMEWRTTVTDIMVIMDTAVTVMDLGVTVRMVTDPGVTKGRMVTVVTTATVVLTAMVTATAMALAVALMALDPIITATTALTVAATENLDIMGLSAAAGLLGKGQDRTNIAKGNVPKEETALPAL